MIKLSNESELWNEIHKALRITISTHGVIHMNLVDSATKRILGRIKSLLHNSEIRKVKHIRNSNGEYEERIIQ